MAQTKQGQVLRQVAKGNIETTKSYKVLSPDWWYANITYCADKKNCEFSKLNDGVPKTFCTKV